MVQPRKSTSLAAVRRFLGLTRIASRDASSDTYPSASSGSAASVQAAGRVATSKHARVAPAVAVGGFSAPEVVLDADAQHCWHDTLARALRDIHESLDRCNNDDGNAGDSAAAEGQRPAVPSLIHLAAAAFTLEHSDLEDMGRVPCEVKQVLERARAVQSWTRSGVSVQTWRAPSNVRSDMQLFDMCALSGGRRATASASEHLFVWDASGALERTLIGHTSWSFAVAPVFASSGVLASASADKTIRLWNVDKDLGRGVEDTSASAVLLGHTNSIFALASPAGSGRLASGSDDQTVRVWDIATQQQELLLRPGAVWCVKAVPGVANLVVAAGIQSRRVHVYDFRSGQEVHSFQSAGVIGDVCPLAGVPSFAVGEYVAGQASSIKIYDMRGGGRSPTTVMHGHQHGINSLSLIHEASNLIASAGHDKSIRIWRPTMTQPLRVLHGHTGAVRKVERVIDQAGHLTLASMEFDPVIKLWSLRV